MPPSGELLGSREALCLQVNPVGRVLQHLNVVLGLQHHPGAIKHPADRWMELPCDFRLCLPHRLQDLGHVQSGDLMHRPVEKRSAREPVSWVMPSLGGGARMFVSPDVASCRGGSATPLRDAAWDGIRLGKGIGAEEVRAEPRTAPAAPRVRFQLRSGSRSRCLSRVMG